MLLLLIIINKGMREKVNSNKQMQILSPKWSQNALRRPRLLPSLEKFPAFCATLLSTEKCKSATNRD